MAPEIPAGYSGYWGYNEGQPWATGFNGTVPTNNRPASNFLTAYGGPNLAGYVTDSWYDDAPLLNVVGGCPGSCRLNLTAPALFPTECTTHTVPFNGSEDWDSRGYFTGYTLAPPLSSEALVSTTNLIFRDGRESISLINGFATTSNNCIGTLTYTICTLESGM